MFACLLFGFLDAVQIRLQGVDLPLVGQVPVQAIQALPYLLTVVLLAGFIGKAIPPRAGGVPSHNPLKATAYLGRAVMALLIALIRPKAKLDERFAAA